jgi:NAD(P)-dependent dehydrogenase (short-subunit alcohol dehydrogenase family)
MTRTSTRTPVALVTGASSGIGRSTAAAFADIGFIVVGTSRRVASAALNSGVELIDLDVTEQDSVTRAVQEVVDRFGRIDVLVNNAGAGSIGAVEDASIEHSRALFETNVFGVMRMVKEVLPHMRAKGNGRVVNVSSVQGFLPAPFSASYGATKHAIEGWSQSLDHEVRQYGIRSILVEPAYTKTGFEANSQPPDAPLPVYEQQRRIAGEVLARAIERGDDPALVAEVIVTAATTDKPRLRYTAGPLATRAGVLRRIAPAPVFDRQMRKMNRLRH